MTNMQNGTTADAIAASLAEHPTTTVTPRARREEILRLVGPADEVSATEASGTRRKLLEIAADMFAVRGFDACTMRDLAAAVGVKAPALYNHFASKEQLLAEAMGTAIGDFYRFVLGSLDDEPEDHWLELLVRRNALYYAKYSSAARVSDLLLEREALSQHLPEEDLTRLMSIHREFRRLIRDLVGDATDWRSTPQQNTVMSFAIVAMSDQVNLWYRGGGSLTPDDVAEHTWSLVARMLGTPESWPGPVSQAGS